MDVKVNKDISIVIPTYHEAKNIPSLIKRISAIDLGNKTLEVILVDDNSNDGIVEIVNDLSKTFDWLKVIVRHEKRGLSESVLEGFNNSNGNILIVMDADLSHPPEKIPVMLKMLSDPSVDFVIGSRYVQEGTTDEVWPISRKMTSRFAALIAKLLLFADVNDPLSGFFAVRKSTLNNGIALAPIGWKIGLEIMMKCHCKNIKEIPIHFSERHKGVSKLNYKVVLSYIRHVKRLIIFRMSSG